MSKLNKRNIIIFIVVILLIIAAVLGISQFIESSKEDVPTLSEIVEEKFSAYETDFIDSLASMTSDDAVAEYLLNWGKNRKISVAKDLNNNIIFSIKATKDYEDTPPAVIICGYDSSDMNNYVEPIAAALTIAKNSKNHGKYKVIFCPESREKRVGAAFLSSSNFTDDTSVFYLSKSSESRVAAATGGYRLFRLNDSLEYAKPEYDKAYKISISGIPSVHMTEQDDSLPNPIKLLGNLLANLKTNSILFEIGNIKGGESSDSTPSSASMTLVINSSDFSKFRSKVEGAIEAFNDKYSWDYPEISYTYEETDMPSKVLTEEKTDNLVSLLYTSFSGVYNRDSSGNIVAVTNIGKISTKKDRLTIDVAAMSYSEEYSDEMVESYETISGLCSVKFSCKEEYDIYIGGEKSSALLGTFQDAFKEFSDSSIKNENTVAFTPCTFLAEKNENMALIFCGITEENKQDIAGSVITWLDNSKAKQ